MQLSPSGEHTPCANINCQYSLHKLAIISPSTCNTAPPTSNHRGPWQSLNHPTSGPGMKKTNICTDGIHAIVDDGYADSWCCW